MINLIIDFIITVAVCGWIVLTGAYITGEIYYRGEIWAARWAKFKSRFARQ